MHNKLSDWEFYSQRVLRTCTIGHLPSISENDVLGHHPVPKKLSPSCSPTISFYWFLGEPRITDKGFTHSDDRHKHLKTKNYLLVCGIIGGTEVVDLVREVLSCDAS